MFLNPTIVRFLADSIRPFCRRVRLRRLKRIATERRRVRKVRALRTAKPHGWRNEIRRLKPRCAVVLQVRN